jgi:uncharacterized protein YbjT (DUF2867 family)
MNLLVIGGTGTLGRQIVKEAIDEGYNVKCFVRNLRRSLFLKEWGAELIYGDLSLPETIPNAIKGINIVIDASTLRVTDDYKAETIDLYGKIALIKACQLAKIDKFIFLSLTNSIKNSKIPLIDLKLKIEQVLQKSELNFTVYKCSGFFQGIINQYAIPLLENKTIWLVKNSSPIPYLDTQDASKQIIKNLTNQNSNRKILSLIGTKAWNAEEVINLCERLSGKKANISYIPRVILIILRIILRFFEFTWNISDRLYFSEILEEKIKSDNNVEESIWFFERLNLEIFLKEYFSKILKKLKETNYQQLQKNSEISFL